MKNLIESQGVVENGFNAFAEYLWQRCINNKRRPNRYGEIIFTIPSAQWNKYNTYKLTNDRIQIIISDDTYADASFSYIKGQPILSISNSLLYDGKSSFISSIMHELTHAVNGMSNLQNGRHPFDRNKPKLERYATPPNTVQGKIGYLFTPTEINARLTELYYYLIENKEDYIDLATRVDKNSLIKTIIDNTEKITSYKKMVRYTNLVYKDSKPFSYSEYGYDQYKMDLERDNYYDGIPTSKLKFKNSKPSLDHSFQQYYKRKLDIVFYMQEQCEKFRKRILKVIYKFLVDAKIMSNQY